MLVSPYVLRLFNANFNLSIALFKLCFFPHACSCPKYAENNASLMGKSLTGVVIAADLIVSFRFGRCLRAVDRADGRDHRRTDRGLPRGEPAGVAGGWRQSGRDKILAGADPPRCGRLQPLQRQGM